MKRLFASGTAILLLWALAPGLGEVVETAAHFAREGHAAHAAPEGDRHEPAAPEHGCTGARHLCSCCVSLNVVAEPSFEGEIALEPHGFALVDGSPLSTHAAERVYHPPRV